MKSPTIVKALLTFATLLATTTTVHAGEDILLADFEGDDYADWKALGDAFGVSPARGTLARQQAVSGFRGKGLVNTYLRGDRTTGSLTSPEFTVSRKHIGFLIGGGRHPMQTCMNLLIDGRVVRSATGQNKELLAWASFDVARFAGRRARLQIVDRATGGWGHINIDHIVLTDAPEGRTVGSTLEGQREMAATRLTKHGVEEIIFAARQVDSDGHWYANFSYWSNNPNRKLYHDGGRLAKLNVKTGKVTTLLHDPAGGVRDPQVHYDGRKILFSYRKGGQPFYRLYEINADGTGLRQLTDGPYDDIEPAYLPDGGIVFCSSRCNRMVNCWFVRVAVLYRCDGDGKNIRPLSANIEQDNTPWVLPDGRILHQRWEYIDRSQVRFHHLWTMNPDGTGAMVYYGNMHGSTLMIDAKPIPGSNKIVASFSPGHGRREHAGTITVVDPGRGPDDRGSAKPLHRGRMFRDPYPVSDDCFLVAGETDISVMDGDGTVRRLYDLPVEWRVGRMLVHEPRPLRARPREKVIPSRIDKSKSTGLVALENVYIGRNMAGVKRGEIKKLLVLEALPKPVNFSGGWEPLSFGGTFTLERVLGTVPVEPDGSAYMELPAMRSLLFVALDANDLAVKRMQSFLTIQPGEVFSCVGCHEHRQQTPRSTRSLTAMRRPPSRIRPVAGVPDVFDYPRDIQPILDKHCVSCHDYAATKHGGPRSGGVILTGDRGPIYSHSYFMMVAKNLISDGRNADGNRPPRTIGSSASRLMSKLDGRHHKAKLTDHERKMVRLWIESAATYPGTYAALGTGMLLGPNRASDMVNGFNKETRKIIITHCAPCHSGSRRLPQDPSRVIVGGFGGGGRINPKDPKLQFASQIVFNLTRPESSLLLLAPLAKTAGGYDLCRPTGEADRKDRAPVFADTTDPGYRRLLKAIRTSKAELEGIKRFDMPGFRPNEHYIREMKVYGILPTAFGATDPIDVYKIDRTYWRSLWHRPGRPK